VGAAAGILADTEWQVSFLAGYAGTDFIESLYKSEASPSMEAWGIFLKISPSAKGF